MYIGKPNPYFHIYLFPYCPHLHLLTRNWTLDLTLVARGLKNGTIEAEPRFRHKRRLRQRGIECTKVIYHLSIIFLLTLTCSDWKFIKYKPAVWPDRSIVNT